MTHKPFSFSTHTITIGDRNIETEYPIHDAFLMRDKIIVLFHPDAYTEKFGQFKNLIALTLEGAKIWTAELPTNDSGDRYYQISSKLPLIADSVYSFECEIDESTGRIKKGIFFK
jgi:hypothetical protein